jgi:glycerol-3-phosphate acyltransferase PlsY
VDDEEVEKVDNLRRVLNRPKKHPAPVLVADQPWEGERAQAWGSVVLEPSGLLRLWYFAFNTERRAGELDRGGYAYAQSRDGMRWDKPKLGVVEFRGSKDNNLFYTCAPDGKNLVDEELARRGVGLPALDELARRRGVDLRRAGSGNVGAANVLRTSGVPNAIVALCLDAAKGAFAVMVAQRLSSGPTTPVAAGLAAVIGHIYPVWLGCRGGKGVATTAGAFVVLAPTTVAIAAAVFTLAIWMTRYVSVGSMTAAVTLAVTTAAADVPSVGAVGAAVAAVIIVHRHRGNLARLLAGTERRVGERLL